MSDLQERSLTISGVKVIFPCKPYPSQFGMMDRVIKGLERKQNGLLESPTGSGKSLALLCSALAWQHAQHEKITREQLSAQKGNDYCGSCTCGSKEYSPETKPGHSKTQGGGISHNPVELSDDDNNGSEDDDFKPASKMRIPVLGGSRKHVSIAYENSQEDKTTTSPGEQTKCTCFERSTASGKKPKVPKIFFGTRTHKQIAQITRELKKTAYHDVRMAILASREYTCIHPEVVRMKSKSEGCKERLDSRGPGCKFNDKSKRVYLNQSQLQDSLPTAWDIEDFVKSCKGKKACPYFVTRNIIDGADIIFCPYNYLIDPLVRNSMEIDLKDQIVILDEAHNMEDSAREAGSGSITTDQITQGIHNLQELLDHNVKFMVHLKLKKMLENVLQFIEDNSSSLAQKDYDQAYKVWSGFDIVVRLKSVGLGPEEFKENKDCLAKAMESEENEAEVRGRQNQELKLSSATLQTLEQIFQVLDYMYRNDLKFVEDYRVAILKTRTFVNNKDTNDMWINSRHRNKAARMMEIHTLNFWCMNPAVAFSDFTPARNVILSSGTLSPMSSFASELGVPFPIQLEANHVIQDKQVWVGAIGQGPSGSTLQAVYKNMETLGFQDELGQLIHKVCMTVPHGVLCFLPSYRSLEKFTDRWKLTGLWRKIAERKRIMIEPRAANRETFDDMMKAFYRVVNGETSLNMAEEDEDACYDDSGIDGALFFAVCRGKVSEGMDFADNNARAVITVGIPYPSIKDLQVKLKREYNDRYRLERGLLSGNEWYEIQAFRALNQALGRCLRHRKDWGALIIVDDRFVRNKDKYCKGLSKWVRSKVQTFENFSQTMDSLSVFTEQMIKEMPVVDADTSFIPSTPGTVRRESIYRSMDDSTYISNSQFIGSQGNSSYFSSPENPPLKATNFQTPQSCRKIVNPTPKKGTTSEVSPKGANPSVVQSPVTPGNQQFQQIMDIVNSAAAPKDKPYYIILNQGLPNEQTFLIEPPGKGTDKRASGQGPAAQTPRDLPVIAVPSTQKVMTPVASKLANKMAALTGSPALPTQMNKTGATVLTSQAAIQNSFMVSGQVPDRVNSGSKTAVLGTNLLNLPANTQKETAVKNDLVSTMSNQIQSSQFLLQSQQVITLNGTPMLTTQPQGLMLVENNSATGPKQILLSQPQGLVSVVNVANTGQAQMTSLLGNNAAVDPHKAAQHVTPNKLAESNDQKNKFLKFVNFPTSASKVATVAPMRPSSGSVVPAKPDKDKPVISDEIIASNNKSVVNNSNLDISKANSSSKSKGLQKSEKDTNEDSAKADNVDCNTKKRPLFKSRKSLPTQVSAKLDTCEKKNQSEKEKLSDTDEDFKTEKHIRKDIKSEKSNINQSATELKEQEKSKSETVRNTGKTFNAAGMRTRRKPKHPSLETAGVADSAKCSGLGGEEITEVKLTDSETNKSMTRGETKKSVADKLKQFRRNSADTEVLQEVNHEANDFVEKIKSPLGSPDVLNTRRRKSGRKRRSSPNRMKSKRSKGVDFVDEVDEKKENKTFSVDLHCSECGNSFTDMKDFQKRRRFPNFLKKVWPQNAEVLFFPSVKQHDRFQVASSSIQDGTDLNCLYDPYMGCAIQFLRCLECAEGRQNDKIIGARIIFCDPDSEFEQNQTWLLSSTIVQQIQKEPI